MKELKPKYFLYARKSTEDDDHQIMSIEAQLFELREYARRENIEILSEFTESKSAKKPGREKFGEMVELIEKSHEPMDILSWHPLCQSPSVDNPFSVFNHSEKTVFFQRTGVSACFLNNQTISFSF